MSAPFAIVHRNGINWVDAVKDAAFRKALTDGVPASLRGKMREALAATPDSGARQHSERYFGGAAELRATVEQIAPLLMELNSFLTRSLHLPGLFDWLDVTGYGNDYRMIKVFKAWSEMKLTPPDNAVGVDG